MFCKSARAWPGDPSVPFALSRAVWVVASRSLSVETSLADIKMVRTTTDGYLSLTDLIREWTNLGKQHASLHIRNLVTKCLLPHGGKVHLGNGGAPSHVMTRAEWG